MSAVRASLTFVVDTGVTPVAATHGPGGRLRRYEGTFETHEVTLADAREAADPPRLDREGFARADHATAVRDFHDEDELARLYHPEVERLLVETTGARRVVVFDHTVRSADAAEAAAGLLREPVRIAHNDYTEWSGPQRLRDVLPDEAETLSARRFAIVQVWRATHEPIAADPLALCDARSVRPEDLVKSERRHLDRVGEIYQLAFHPDQRWWHVPALRRDEALVFVVYDSATDGRARFTPHASFEDPTAPPDAPPRRSIEARALCLF
ncbi:MAG TPA: CmcJ/NvfI family oxidoreductase [Sandaracinaceae bacterium LLY-WYZ-13_1]|nr:CmcJ/NvfI family oxidoreductase [Sandaracinaceae bacterium LLY-WYZ-13_1]